MFRKILPSLLLSSLCISAFAFEPSTTVNNRTVYAGAKSVHTAVFIFDQVGKYNVVCTLEKALGKNQYIKVSYDDNGSPSPALSGVFDDQHNSISINNVPVSASTVPFQHAFAMFDYTTSQDFAVIWADCTYTLQAAK